LEPAYLAARVSTLALRMQIALDTSCTMEV
jgi:hypothetical protein